MKSIVFTNPCRAKLLNENIMPPQNNEVQIKLCVSTISSGTERANYLGEERVTIADTPVSFPRRCGYSSSGIVTAIGEDVRDFAVGDRVAMSWTVHSEIVNLNQKFVYKIDDISFEAAALFHIATFPLAAIRKCRLELGESAVIMGLGVLGLTAIPLLKAAGAAPIIAADPVLQKREKALSLGADYAFDPLSPEFAHTVKEITRGGAKVGIEVTGIGAGLDGILDVMAPFGRVALLGCTRNNNFSIDYYKKVHGPGISLIGAHTLARPQEESCSGWWTLKDDIAALTELTKLKRIDLGSIIDEKISPNEAQFVYERLGKESFFPVVQFDWRLL